MSLISRAESWQLKTQKLDFDRWPKIMGILNVTPDSFSDGGKYIDTSNAIAHARKLISEGADILDIGGESTRPYSEPVDEQKELDRVIPVVESINSEFDIPISIDTSKSVVARAAIDAGAEIINDVTGLEGDSNMLQVAMETSAGVCAMHMQGTPQTMQDDPKYDDVVDDIFRYLALRRDKLTEAGIDEARICLDPGIGFGKTHEHNFRLINECEKFLNTGHPILIGHSRKGFIAKAIGDNESNRDLGTLAASILMAQKGIQVLRVHNVAATQQGLLMLRSIVRDRV